jgi:chromosomal replication initiator protein
MSLDHTNATNAWNQCLSIIKDSINPQSYVTWFKPIKPKSLEGQNLTLAVPSQFFYEWLETHYSILINQALMQVLGESALVIFTVAANGVNGSSTSLHFSSFEADASKPQPAIVKNGSLNQRYQFSNFVEGANNQFARAAALAVAEEPGKTTFNPLVIYGGVGLGKTHLIQAIGNFTLINGLARNVLYVNSERFTVDFITSIQNNKTTEFSATYRNVDVLLVDDIQFFVSKERTQEEFFHTFNSLYHAGKQIVLSSDRPPKDLRGIEERLLSRFQWGLVADIQVPDLETRTAILQKKAEENEMAIPAEIIEYIATNITSNIRELEGALNRLLAYAALNGTDITLEIAKDILKNVSLDTKKRILIEEIQRIVGEHYAIPDDLLRAKTRKKEIAYARQVAMYMTKMLTNSSLKTIGLHFGGRDHTTVIHAVQCVENLITADPKVREEMTALRKKIELSGS